MRKNGYFHSDYIQPFRQQNRDIGFYVKSANTFAKIGENRDYNIDPQSNTSAR
jgi:hypothetical protein